MIHVRPNLLLCLLALALFFACNNTEQSNKTLKDSTVVKTYIDTSIIAMAPAPQETSADTSIAELNDHILTQLKNRNYSALTQFIHPGRGVRFSPYGYIDTLRNKRLSAAQFEQMIGSSEQLFWGEYDGSGDSILLTGKAYFERFVYNRDFLNAEKTSLNKTLGRGNALENLHLVYKDHPYVESYFSGFDKKYGGIDWCSLRMVYQQLNGKYYIVGIIHNEWTS
ncbi:MAG: hypothetical protein EOO03_05235 [Chitinophagaceae bacterium]|nr:MAG: hypothetical protein EOO03_05235 [Chitinophagaceae bacterium]